MLNTTVVNARIVYHEITRNKVKISQFQHNLIYALADAGEPGMA